MDGNEKASSLKAAPQARFLVTVGLLIGATVYLHASADALRVPGHRPLKELPSLLGSFRGTDLPLTARVIESAGMDDYVNRRYSDDEGNWLDLYIGYYNSQRTGDVIHSPRNCLPGAGWEQKRTGYQSIGIPGSPGLVVNDFLIVKGLERQVVLYWYQGRGRAIASEYSSKFWMMSDALLRRRSDGALVRISMHVADGDKDTRDLAVGFVQILYPHLKQFIPE